jgi:L-lysine 6-transaminase
MEPIPGGGGRQHTSAPSSSARIRPPGDENELLLNFDEVQSGVGLTGKMWCFQHTAWSPTLFCKREEDA